MRFVAFFLLLVALTGGVCAQTSVPEKDSPHGRPRPVLPPGPKLETSTSNLPAQNIGPNDLIDVSVEDTPEWTKAIRVSAEGTIRLPMVKRPIKVEGLMPSEVEDAIASALKSEQLVLDPIVTVTITEYRSHPVSVVGAVEVPTTFQATMPVTLLQAIAQAGGLSEDAGPEVLVSRTSKRPGEEKTVVSIQRIPIAALINATDPQLNVVLRGGEIVSVPQAGRVYVLGMVNKPGAIPMLSGSDTTVLRVLALADGLQTDNDGQAFIYRRDASGTKSDIPINLKKIINRESPDVPLMANDILYIPGDNEKDHKPGKPGSRAGK